MEAYQNLIKIVAENYRTQGDTVVLMSPCIGKSSWTGNELDDEIENQTEHGQRLVNNLVLLAVDLVTRGKETLPKDKPLPPPSRMLKEGEEPKPLK